jgi:hypothetical protein
MRRLVAALMLVAVAATLAACGGGATGATSTAPGTVAPVAAQPVTPESSLNASDTRSPKELVHNEQFPTDKSSVPQAVLDRLKAKQAMLIFFFDTAQIVTTEERDEVDAVVSKYRGLIDLVAYDVESGLASTDASRDVETRKAFTMAGLVGVKHTPYVLFVDRAGRITGRFSGFADRTLLEREVLRATN